MYAAFVADVSEAYERSLSGGLSETVLRVLGAISSFNRCVSLLFLS